VCTVVDSAGREVTFNPNSPGTPTQTAIDGDPQMNALSDNKLSVACPSASQCTAVDCEGREVTFDPATPGSPTPVTIGGYYNSLNAVACPSASLCTAVDGRGREVTFNPAAPAASQGPIKVDGGSTLSGVACPSASQCTAVDSYGGEVTFNPAAPGNPTPISVDPSRATFGGVSAVACPSVSQCTAVDFGGAEVTFNPTSPGTPTPVTVAGENVPCVNPSGCTVAHNLSAVACPTLSQCTAVDLDGGEVTFNPNGPGSPIRNSIDGSNLLFGVACPTASQCTAVDFYGNEVTFNPLRTGHPKPVRIDGTYNLNAVACPSASQCTAVAGARAGSGQANPGQEVTFNPRFPSGQIRVAVDSGNELHGVACPSALQCTAVDADGHEVTVDPLDSASPTPASILDADPLETIACSSITQCVSVDAIGNGFVGTGNGFAGLAGQAKIGHATVRSTHVRLPIHCHGNDSQLCRVTLTLTATEKTNSGNVVAVTAAKHRLRTRTVVLGRATITVNGGETKDALVSLHAAAKRLLTQHHTRRITLTARQSGLILSRRRLTLELHT
jgi:hypothetical protein